MYKLVRPFLFSQDAEDTHDFVLDKAARWPGLASTWSHASAGAVWEKFFSTEQARRAPALFSRFLNPLGLAAGMDKNAQAHLFWERLGFGFAEFGTVTPRSQQGNTRPRLFRLTGQHALRNAMGFNNEGVEALVSRLHRRAHFTWPMGVSIGKQRETPVERAWEDYRTCARALAGLDLAYIAINVSSPNTPGLRSLQTIESLEKIVAAVRTETRSPLALKIGPDLSPDLIADIAQFAVGSGIAYVIATNTIPTPEGGVSGRPLTSAALQVTRLLYRTIRGRLPIIGVGGVHNTQTALERIRAGAHLLQVYTALVYEGPGLVRQILRGLEAIPQLLEVGADAQ